MTKALLCGKCMDMRMLGQAAYNVRTCECGNVSAWWTNPLTGTAEFYAKDRSMAFGIGMNNRLLNPALKRIMDHGYLANDSFRQFHDEAVDAPGYYFDKSMMNCWAIVFKPGTTVAGVTWADTLPGGDDEDPVVDQETIAAED